MGGSRLHPRFLSLGLWVVFARLDGAVTSSSLHTLVRSINRHVLVDPKLIQSEKGVVWKAHTKWANVGEPLAHPITA